MLADEVCTCLSLDVMSYWLLRKGENNVPGDRIVKTKLLLLMLTAAIVMLLTASVMAQDALPTWKDLPAGEWTMIPAGGETICSDGSPYSFFARPADSQSDKLLIHFQGGGACWFGLICDLKSNPSYDPTVDASDTPANYDGIFNFQNEANPFGDYNMVFAPYCTGDVHVGNQDTTYVVKDGSANRDVLIHHRGYANATTVLNWTFDNVKDPSSVFVTGCSAGSIPTPLYTQFVAEAYPKARIEELGDSSGSYRAPSLSKQVFSQWGTLSILPKNYSDETVDTLTFEDFYSYTAAAFPSISLAQYNSANDAVQVGFLQLSGITGTPLKELQDANFADILASGDKVDFHTFTAGGNAHCITPTPDFYNYSVNGMSFRDWVAALAAGDAIETVSCTDCATAELLHPAAMTTDAPDMAATAEATQKP